MSPLTVTEAQTRYSLIDPQLEKAGWNLSDRTQVKLEIPVDGYDGSAGAGGKRLLTGLSTRRLADDSSDPPPFLLVQHLEVGVLRLKS